jgi:DnaJ-domain-containing protein 1
MDTSDLSRRQARALLGVAADARAEEVTRAYRRLARSCHPDVSASPDAADRFAAIAQAYDVALDRPSPGTEPHLDVRHSATTATPATHPPTRPPTPPRPGHPLVAGPPTVRPFPREDR